MNLESIKKDIEDGLKQSEIAAKHNVSVATLKGLSGLMVFIWEKENHQDRKYKKCNLLLLISISFSIFVMKSLL